MVASQSGFSQCVLCASAFGAKAIACELEEVIEYKLKTLYNHPALGNGFIQAQVTIGG